MAKFPPKSHKALRNYKKGHSRGKDEKRYKSPTPKLHQGLYTQNWEHGRNSFKIGNKPDKKGVKCFELLNAMNVLSMH